MFKVFHNKRIPYVLVFFVPMSSKARDEPDEALADFKLMVMHVLHDILSASVHACVCMFWVCCIDAFVFVYIRVVFCVYFLVAQIKGFC